LALLFLIWSANGLRIFKRGIYCYPLANHGLQWSVFPNGSFNPLLTLAETQKPRTKFSRVLPYKNTSASVLNQNDGNSTHIELKTIH